MDCLTIEGDLVPFHFNTLADRERAAVEQHLGGCAACLGAYFDVKRAIDRNGQPRPSAALKARLRESVLAEVRPRRLRFVPYAAVAACVAIATVVGIANHRRSPVEGPVVQAQTDEAPPPEQLPPRFAGAVDSARDPNQRLAFY